MIFTSVEPPSGPWPGVMLSTVDGFGSVLTVSSAPLLVPPAFVAEILKW